MQAAISKAPVSRCWSMAISIGEQIASESQFAGAAFLTDAATFHPRTRPRRGCFHKTGAAGTRPAPIFNRPEATTNSVALGGGRTVQLWVLRSAAGTPREREPDCRKTRCQTRTSIRSRRGNGILGLWFRAAANRIATLHMSGRNGSPGIRKLLLLFSILFLSPSGQHCLARNFAPSLWRKLRRPNHASFRATELAQGNRCRILFLCHRFSKLMLKTDQNQ